MHQAHMTQWADYIITCVNMTAAGDKIATVGVYAGDKLGTRTPRATWHRSQVVKKLGEDKKPGQKYTFVTAIKEGGTWKKGAAVKRYAVNGEWFIKTKANDKAKDNLGSLPECS